MLSSSELRKLHRSTRCNETWRTLQTYEKQSLLMRLLANVGDAGSGSDQVLILRTCRRALHPRQYPLWPMERMLQQVVTRKETLKILSQMGTSTQLSVLPALVCATPESIDLIHHLSEQIEAAERVAHALCCTEYQPYMRMLGLSTLWHMIPYLREHNATYALQRLANAHAGIALRHGVITQLIATKAPLPITLPLCFLHAGSIHHNVAYMHETGVVPSTHVVAEVAQREPAALHAIAARWESINRAFNWVRRRLFVMSVKHYSGSAVEPLWHGVALLDEGPLSTIVQYI